VICTFVPAMICRVWRRAAMRRYKRRLLKLDRHRLYLHNASISDLKKIARTKWLERSWA
jgi:hypothetical protein